MKSKVLVGVVAAVLVAAGVGLALVAYQNVTGNSLVTAGSSGPDSGVAQCRKLAETAASPKEADNAVPTDEEFDQVERAYSDSRYSDLERAGLSHLKAVRAYYDGSENVSIADVMIKRSALEATCATHGVTISQPPMPSFEPPPPMDNPYDD